MPSHKRWILAAIGAWTALAGASALLDPAGHLALYAGDLDLRDPMAAFFFRATWIQVTSWGLGYLLAAYRPQAAGPVLLAGAVGKTLYFVTVLLAYQDAVASSTLLGFAMLDLVFAAYFVHFVLATPGQSAVSTAASG